MKETALNRAFRHVISEGFTNDEIRRLIREGEIGFAILEATQEADEREDPDKF